MISPILTTKFYVPEAHGPLVERRNLLDKMSAGVKDSTKLIFICAPAGFGKSTLVSAWLKTQSTAVAWLSLDEQDDSLEQFLAYLIGAIQKVHSGFAINLSEQIQYNKTGEIESLLPVLANALCEIPLPLVIALDDYHVINHPKIHTSLTYLIEHVPKGVIFLIATRVMPPISLARWRAQRQLLDFRLQDLRFQTSEIAYLFNRIYALSLSDSEISALEVRTEGWPAGLQLAALALQAEKDNTHDFIEQFNGRHEYIADYLFEEVLNRQPDDLTDFLLKTSILDRFSAPLCQTLTGKAESEALLHDLFARNVFLIPLDSERHWFRYHHLFVDLLHARLKNTQPEIIPELHAKASAWFEENGLIQEAMDHALAGQDFLTVERIVRENWTAMLHQRSVPVTLRWLSALPRMASQPNLMPDVVQSTLDWFGTLSQESFEAYPSLYIAYAWTLYLNHQINKAEIQHQHAEGILTRMLSEGRMQKNDKEYRAIKASGKVLRVYLLYARNELESAMLLASTVWGEIQAETSIVKGNLQLILGLIYKELDHPEQAIKAYRTAIPLVWKGGNTIGTMSAYAGLISIYCAQAEFSRAEQTFQEAWKLMADNNIENIPAAGILFLERANLLLAEDKPEEARSALDTAVEVAQESGYKVFHIKREALRGRLKIAHRNVDQSTLFEPLTTRELDVLHHLSDGCSNQDIADKLVISLATAKKHTSSILAKLHASNRTQAIAIARKNGIL